jgi:hypothetical protein
MLDKVSNSENEKMRHFRSITCQDKAAAGTPWKYVSSGGSLSLFEHFNFHWRRFSGIDVAQMLHRANGKCDEAIHLSSEFNIISGATDGQLASPLVSRTIMNEVHVDVQCVWNILRPDAIRLNRLADDLLAAVQSAHTQYDRRINVRLGAWSE